ncbi:MAG TPA: hypothetical protein VMG30_21615, partial [Acidobacteriota bacterium]|nr:hypothetical protein [Acidobacteriota bacterium]
SALRHCDNLIPTLRSGLFSAGASRLNDSDFGMAPGFETGSGEPSSQKYFLLKKQETERLLHSAFSAG